MSIKLEITPPAKLEQNLENLEKTLQLIDNKIRACASDLNNSMDVFWGLPDEELLEILNYFGPVKMNEIFMAHNRYAIGFNSYMDDREVEGCRAYIKKLRDDIGFDTETMKFFIIPPVVEEELPTEPEQPLE